jgi:hypothetical protein
MPVKQFASKSTLPVTAKDERNCNLSKILSMELMQQEYKGLIKKTNAIFDDNMQC